MKIAVVCCSLNPDSRSAALAEHLRAPLDAAGVTTDWIDLRDHPLPLCDGGAAYADPHVSDVAPRLAAADAIVLALPIYNFDVNAAAKNLVELDGPRPDREGGRPRLFRRRPGQLHERDGPDQQPHARLSLLGRAPSSCSPTTPTSGNDTPSNAITDRLHRPGPRNRPCRAAVGVTPAPADAAPKPPRPH